MGDKDDFSGHLLNELDKVCHRTSLIDVFNTSSFKIHDTVFSVHCDLVNFRSFPMDVLERPDISTEHLVTVQRCNLDYVAVRLCAYRHYYSFYRASAY